MQLVNAETGGIEGQASKQNLVLVDDKFKFTPTGLVVRGSPTFEEWEECGSILAQLQRRIHWWIGDWLNYGEGAYGEKYAQALDETGYSYSTLATDKWVAKKIGLSRRRENLRFSHHREVAGLPPPEQEKWLDKAEKEDLGPKDLRREIRRGRAETGADDIVVLSVNMVFGVPSSLNGKLQEALERLTEYLLEWDIKCTDMQVSKYLGPPTD